VTPSVTQDYTVPTDQMAMNTSIYVKGLRKTTKASARIVII